MLWKHNEGDSAMRTTSGLDISRRADSNLTQKIARYSANPLIGRNSAHRMDLHSGYKTHLDARKSAAHFPFHTLLQELAPYLGQSARIAINQAAAAYNVFQQGEQQGITLGSVLSGAITGYEVGGPVGALVGAGLDIIGGLFHHPHLPPVPSQNLAQLFGPAGFDYLAYRMQYFHTLGPVGSQLGPLPPSLYRLATQFQQPAPTINLYVDGVKTAVNAQLQQSVSGGAASAANVYYNAARPI